MSFSPSTVCVCVRTAHGGKTDGSTDAHVAPSMRIVAAVTVPPWVPRGLGGSSPGSFDLQAQRAGLQTSPRMAVSWRIPSGSGLSPGSTGHPTQPVVLMALGGHGACLLQDAQGSRVGPGATGGSEQPPTVTGLLGAPFPAPHRPASLSRGSRHPRVASSILVWVPEPSGPTCVSVHAAPGWPQVAFLFLDGRARPSSMPLAHSLPASPPSQSSMALLVSYFLDPARTYTWEQVSRQLTKAAQSISH